MSEATLGWTLGQMFVMVFPGHLQDRHYTKDETEERERENLSYLCSPEGSVPITQMSKLRVKLIAQRFIAPRLCSYHFAHC